MKNAFVIVTLSALLAACAVTRAPPPLDASTQPAIALQSGQDEEPAVDESLPKIALSADLLYQLTKAEFEFRRGHWQPGYIALMAIAQQTRDPRIAQRAAEMALAAKQAGEALAAIRLWRTLAPNSEEANQYLLGFIVLSEDLGEAEAIFSQRLQAAPPAVRALAMFQIQQLLMRAKNKAAAFGVLERVLAPYGTTLEAHLVLAQSAFAKGDTVRARSEAQQARRIDPDSELAVLTLAQVTPEQGTVTALLTGFLAGHPGAREVRAAYARILVNDKQYTKARNEFLVLLKGQPDNLATLYALGIVSMQINDNKAAETHFKHFISALEAHPDDERDPSRVLMILSELAEQRGDGKAALEWIDKIDDADPRAYFGAQLKRAQLMGKHGDLDGARKFLAGLRSTEPREQAQIVLAQAQLLRDAGRQQAAFAVLEAGVKRFPGNPDLLYDFALVAEKNGRMDVMETSLRAVMVHAPDNHHAYNALGFSLAERNIRLAEAYALIDKALKMAPDDPFIMDSMGWVQFRLGRLQEAEDLLRRAYALRGDAEIAVHLGEVLWFKGQKGDAQKLWREARSKDPQSDALKSTLARLKSGL